MRNAGLVAVLLAALAPPLEAYQADLVPVPGRPEAQELSGSVSIGGEDGTIRVRVEGVNGPDEVPLDGTLTVHLRVRADGRRRKVVLPVRVEAGDGEATTSLGLTADARVVVGDVRLRGPNHRTLAAAGVVTAAASVEPPPAPPPPDECPGALSTCQEDLLDCQDELTVCEESL
jgi:hypothetical protein